jgi:hypothetical protein
MSEHPVFVIAPTQRSYLNWLREHGRDETNSRRICRPSQLHALLGDAQVFIADIEESWPSCCADARRELAILRLEGRLRLMDPYNLIMAFP